MFTATVEGLGGVIVKFCEQYGVNAHKDAGYAPKLYCCEKVTPRYMVIVMEEVNGVFLEQDNMTPDVLNNVDKP